MKRILPLIVFLCFASISFAQDKYAVLLSAIPQQKGADKQVARNNFSMMYKALRGQGFAPGNIVFDTTNITQEVFYTLFRQIEYKARKGDFILIYSDLLTTTKQYEDSTYERGFKIGSKGSEFIGMTIFKELLMRLSTKLGDKDDLFFTILDSEIPPALNGRSRVHLHNVAKSYTINLMAATSSAKEKRVIKDKVSIFTKAVADALMHGSMFNTTYRTFGNQVKKEIYMQTSAQLPVAEGHPDAVLFRGMFNKFPAHFMVISAKGNEVIINAGSGVGLEEGAIIKLYPAFTQPQPQSMMAEGVVTKVSPTTSTVKLQQSIGQAEAWAYISQSNNPVKLQFNTNYEGANKTEFAKILSSLQKWEGAVSHVQFVNKGGDLGIGYIKQAKGDSLELTLINPATGFIYRKMTVAKDISYTKILADDIVRHRRFKVMYRLENYVPELSVVVDLLPKEKNPTIENGYLIMHEAETFSLKISNTGTVPVYYSLVDMLPDRTMKVLIPNEGTNPLDFKVMPGDRYTIEEVQTDGYSFGLERFKVFSSLTPFDLRPLIEQKATRASAGVLDNLFKEQQGGYTRSGSATAYTAYAEMNITNVDFEIRSAGYARQRSKRKAPAITYQKTNDKEVTHIHLRNTSQEAIYFNVLTQKEDGSFAVLLPHAQFSSNDCVVNYDTAASFPLSTSLQPEQQLLTVYSDRPLDLRDYTSNERDLNQMVVEILREGRLPGTPYNKIGVLQQFYQPDIAHAVSRDGSNLLIRMITPKLLNERALVKAKTKTFDLAGIACANGTMPVKTVKVNGDIVSYDTDMKLFEKSVELTAGNNNKIVIEAIDDKGFSVATTIYVELEGGNTMVSSAGKNYFLGIGIDSYKSWPVLFNAAKDVQNFATLIKDKFQFDNITLLLDTAASRKNIIKSIRQFLTKVGPADNVIIYLSGHGNLDQLADGEYYFIPQEADPEDVDTYIKSTDIVDNFKRIKARHCVLIVDACYSGMITNSVYGVTNKVSEQKDEPPSKWIITSGRATKVLDGKPGENSPFAASLINYLKDNNNNPSLLKISKVISYLEDVVPKISSQKPLGKLIEGEGELIFIKK